MRISFTMLFGIYVVAEVVLMVWFASAFGTAALIWALLAGFLLGLLVMRIAGISAMTALTNAERRTAAFGVTGADGSEQVVMGAQPTGEQLQQTVQRAARDVGRSSLLFVAGLLLASPGLISDVAGLVLLIGPVRDRLARRISRSMQVGRAGTARVTVVTADQDGFTATEWTTRTAGQPDQSRPRVIRGEILPPNGDQDH